LQLVSAIVVALAGQFLLGVAIYTVVARLLRPGVKRGGRQRRRWAGWAAGTRELCRITPLWLALLAVATAPHAWAPSGIGGALHFWTAPWWFLLIGALPTSSCFVMVRAGARESRGQVRGARRQVRSAGILTFFGSFGVLLLVWTGLLFRVPFRRAMLAGSPVASVSVTVAIACLGIGGFVALLAGLSRKPRPTAYFGALLYLAGIVGLVTADHFATPIAAGRAPTTVVQSAVSDLATVPAALNRPGSRLD